MARLPKVGGDKGNWGDILNDYLKQAHTEDGTLATNTVGAAQLKPESVSKDTLADGSVSASKLADGAVGTAQLADGSVTQSKVAGAAQADGIATLDQDGRLPETQIPTRLGESELSNTIAEETAGKADADQVYTRDRAQVGATGAVVFLGDSTIKGGASDNPIGSDTTHRWQDSWPVFAAVAANQKFRIVKHAGIWGNTTAQMISRFTSDVAAHKPDAVVIMGGRNDSDVATTMANIATLVDLVRNIGARPVICTPLPTSTSSVLRQRMSTTAYKLRKYAQSERIPCLDFYSLTVDYTTGFMATLYNTHDNSDSGATDGIHPGNTGLKAMGEWAAPILAGLFPDSPMLTALDAADTDNVIGGSQGFFLGISDPSNTGFTTGGWTIGQKPVSGFETFALTTVAGWKGNALSIQTTSWSGGTVPAAQIRRNIPLGASLAVGDVLEYTGKVRVSSNSLSKGNRVQCAILFEGANVTVTAVDTNKTLDGTFHLRHAIPSGTTSVRIQFLVPPDATGAAQLQVGEVNLRNLTKLGLV